jgi:hypothetical protein
MNVLAFLAANWDNLLVIVLVAVLVVVLVIKKQRGLAG